MPSPSFMGLQTNRFFTSTNVGSNVFGVLQRHFAASSRVCQVCASEAHNRRVRFPDFVNVLDVVTKKVCVTAPSWTRMQGCSMSTSANREISTARLWFATHNFTRFGGKLVSSGAMTAVQRILQETLLGEPKNWQRGVVSFHKLQITVPDAPDNTTKSNRVGPTQGSSQRPTNLANPTFRTIRHLLSDRSCRSNPTWTSGREPSVLGPPGNPMFSIDMHQLLKLSRFLTTSSKNKVATSEWKLSGPRRTQIPAIVDLGFELNSMCRNVSSISELIWHCFVLDTRRTQIPAIVDLGFGSRSKLSNVFSASDLT